MPLRRPHSMLPSLIGLCCASLCLGGCAKHGPNATPEATVAAYAQALSRGDAEAALALTSPSARRDQAPEALKEVFARYPAETEALAEALSAPVAAVEQSAWVTLLDGSEVRLERREQGWFVVSPAPELYSQATPRQALESFVQALRHQRWEVLLRLMPDSARGDLGAEELGENLLAQREQWERMLALLETALDSPIEVVGDRATMPYGDGFAVRFLREDGRWKIEDPE